MRKKVTVKGIWQVLKDSFKGFSDDRITKLSGALAYYTVFSFGPLLIVLIFLAGIILGQDAAQGQVYSQMKDFVGPDAAAQLQEIIKNASISGKGNIAAIIGFVTLLIGATTIFAEIQDSINFIWGLKPKPRLGWLKMLINRLLSFSVLVSLGFLLLVSLAVSTLIDAISKRLMNAFPDVTVVVFYIINLLITLIVTASLFAIIFKVLPDAKIKWKDVIAGSIATAILFMLGKFLISLYISKTNVGSTYGTAGSLAVLLVWIYYSAIILYFGAEFTKAYAIRFGSEIHPADYAVTMKQVEVEQGKQSLQQKEKADKKLEAQAKKISDKNNPDGA
jgi:membrane protein